MPHLQHEKGKIPQWGHPHLRQGLPQWGHAQAGQQRASRVGKVGGLGSPISIKKGLNVNVPNRKGGTRVEVTIEVSRGSLRPTSEELVKLIPCKGPRLSSLRMYCRTSNLVLDLKRREWEGRRNRRELLVRRDRTLVYRGFAGIGAASSNTTGFQSSVKTPGLGSAPITGEEATAGCLSRGQRVRHCRKGRWPRRPRSRAHGAKLQETPSFVRVGEGELAGHVPQPGHQPQLLAGTADNLRFWASTK